MGRLATKERSQSSPRSPSLGSFFLLVCLAGPVAVLAGAGLFGLGEQRGLPIWFSASVAIVMVLLPALGLRTFLTGARSRASLAVFLWSLGLLLSLPLYVVDFPSSVRHGLQVALSPAGGSLPEHAGRLGHLVVSQFSRGGRVPLPLATEFSENEEISPLQGADSSPAAEVVDVADDEQPPLSEASLVTLAVEGEGTSLKVKVLVDSAGPPREVQFLFDTGATLTTLDRRTLSELGIVIPEDAPTATLQTAGGQVESSVILLERLWVGHVPIENVAVALCDACAQGATRGLLGLNVTGLFDVTMNAGDQELQLQPVGLDGDRRLDVNHFVDLDASVTMWRMGRVEVAVEASNRAKVVISELVVELVCGERSFAVQVDDIAADGSNTTQLELPRGTNCRTYQVILRSARW
jgi:hypothetical protein